MFDRFKHAKRIGKLEEAVEAMTSTLESLESEVMRILEIRKKERARQMAALRWEANKQSTSKNGEPAGIGNDPVSLKIKDRRRRTLADLALEMPRDPEEE